MGRIKPILAEITTNRVLWVIYIGLLAVLFPHTAWMFKQFEPAGDLWVAFAAALTFELSIVAFTHKLAGRIGATPRYTAGRVWIRRVRYRYLNWFALGLLIAMVVSTFANYSHAVQFGERSLDVYRTLSFDTFALVFGAGLPLVSFVFASAIAASGGVDIESDEPDTRLKEVNAELHQAHTEIDRLDKESVIGRHAAELLFRLNSEVAAERIRAAWEIWPEASYRTLAKRADSSVSHVSGVVGGLLEDGRDQVSEQSTVEHGPGESAG